MSGNNIRVENIEIAFAGNYCVGCFDIAIRNHAGASIDCDRRCTGDELALIESIFVPFERCRFTGGGRINEVDVFDRDPVNIG